MEVKIHAFHILALKEVIPSGLRDDWDIIYNYTMLNGRINSEWRLGECCGWKRWMEEVATFSGGFAKTREATSSCLMFVCPSAWNISVPT